MPSPSRKELYGGQVQIETYILKKWLIMLRSWILVLTLDFIILGLHLLYQVKKYQISFKKYNKIMGYEN